MVTRIGRPKARTLLAGLPAKERRSLLCAAQASVDGAHRRGIDAQNVFEVAAFALAKCEWRDGGFDRGEYQSNLYRATYCIAYEERRGLLGTSLNDAILRFQPAESSVPGRELECSEFEREMRKRIDELPVRCRLPVLAKFVEFVEGAIISPSDHGIAPSTWYRNQREGIRILGERCHDWRRELAT